MDDEFAGLTLVDLLDLLEPVPEPEPVSLWPQTAGWVWLGLALLALAVWGGLKWRERWLANAYRRQALREVAAAGDDPAALAVILKRAALAGFPRADVASLHGEDWLAFLDGSMGGTRFREEPGRQIAAAPYRRRGPVPGLSGIVTEWISRHKRPGAA